MSYIISRHRARTAPGRFRVCRRKDLRTNISTLRPLRPILVFFFYVTVKTRRVSLVFMRRKPIRSRGLPSELTAEHVLEAASGRMRSIFLSVGTDTPSSSFPHSGPTRLLAAGTITLPSVNVFPAGVPLISSFLSSSPLTHESTSQFPWSGRLSVKLRLASQPL